MSDEKKVRVFVSVVGDLFHYGHINYLQKVSDLGDELIIGIHSDDDCLVAKGKKPYLELWERVATVNMLRGHFKIVKIIPGFPFFVSRDFIEKNGIDIVACSSHITDISDVINIHRVEYSAPFEMGILRSIKYTDTVSSTNIVKRITNRQRTEPR
jgi:cytidyltransferase-like protein